MLTEEIRYALRTLVRNPGFTAIATVSLALGIGTNSAIFSLADALLLRPLAIREPSAVVNVSTDPPGDIGGVSYPDYRDFRNKSKSFEGLTAVRMSPLSVAKSASENPRLRAA